MKSTQYFTILALLLIIISKVTVRPVGSLIAELLAFGFAIIAIVYAFRKEPQ